MANAPQGNRELCDLVMKGGATSGLIYPKAVLELRDRYQFRSIGGTSAGAVAAALTAAAEYNREGGGFEQLEAVNGELQGTPENKAFLRDLFQGNQRTQPLLNIFVRMADYMRRLKSASRSRFAVLAYLAIAGRVVSESRAPGIVIGKVIGIAVGAALGALLGAGLTAWTGSSGILSALIQLTVAGLAGFAGYFIGGLGGGLIGLYRIATKEVPRNHFGICSGLSDPGNAVYTKSQPAAMEWIYASVQKIAGRPLDDARMVVTFEDLKARDITLDLMVTNISEGRPYTVPFDEPYIFRKEDFEILFPGAVIERLIADTRTVRGIRLPPGFFFLPRGGRLPVVVGVRLSMSFPLLFSSVPLYALPRWVRERIRDDALILEESPEVLPQSLEEPDGVPGKGSIRTALQKERMMVDDAYAPSPADLIPHWFSDGGITSNFPIHFFDQWLPQAPTFGITLRYLPDYLFATAPDADDRRAARNYLDSMEQAAGSDDRNIGRNVRRLRASAMADEARKPDVVVLPMPEDGVPLEWAHIHCPGQEPRNGAVPGFLWAVIKTMQNYRDNAQAGLPSYRERVVQVRLRPDEGGLNLAMRPETIRGVVTKGELAAAQFRRFNKAHHQWVRLRVLISELDSAFRMIRDGGRFDRFSTLVEAQFAGADFPFRQGDRVWCDEFGQRLDALHGAIDRWLEAPDQVRLDAGNPPPILRVTPKV